MIEAIITMKDQHKHGLGKTLFTLRISTDGSGTEDEAPYRAVLYAGRKGRIVSSCRIGKFKRSKFTAYHLVRDILSRIIEKEKDVRDTETIEGATEKELLREISAQITDPSI